MTEKELHASRVLWAVVTALREGQSLVLARSSKERVEVAIIGVAPEGQQKPVRLRLKAASWEELTRRAALQMSVDFMQADAKK